MPLPTSLSRPCGDSPLGSSGHPSTGAAPLLLLVLGAGCGKTCPEGTVQIPAGEVVFGQAQPSEAWHQPSRTVSLPSYCIDVYEHPNREGALPTFDVTWYEAYAFCAAEGKRLCTSDEWERACRGPAGRTYAYGDLRDKSICNTPIEDGGPGREVMPHAPLGSHPGCVSPEGVYDLNGNVSEWVADPWTGSPEHYNADAVVDPETWRTIRGGTMWKRTFYGQDCTSRHGHLRGNRNMDDGLRCCSDPS